MSVQTNVPIKMDDGTTLLADVYRPNGAPGEKFPVIVTLTPYGKTVMQQLGDPGEALPKAGYIHVIVDIRGTGSSGGTYQLLGPREQADGPEVVRWSATIPGSDGSVGMYGPSYMGMAQLYTAGLMGSGSPLKAIVPVVAGNDDYRDIVAPGGIPASMEVSAFFLGPSFLMSLVPENVVTAPLVALTTLLGRVLGQATQTVPTLMQFLEGGAARWDGFWQPRNPNIPAIAAERIPTLVVGGWDDIFQQGEPLTYTELQNTFAGRTVDGPMASGQKVSPRFQIIDGPWTHIAGGFIPQTEELNSALRWFNTWLKGEDTGLQKQSEPMHLFELGSGRWVNTADWPVAGSKVHIWYFNRAHTDTVRSLNDGTLAVAKPTTATGQDRLPYSLVPEVCSRAETQYVTGAQEGAAALLGLQAAQLEGCLKDERIDAAQSLTYTSARFSSDMDVSGPVSVKLYERSNTPESETVVTLQDVSPSGVATPFDTGYQLGSLRSIDPSLSWTYRRHMIMPVHVDTEASNHPLPPGQVVPVTVSVGPVLARIAKGDRLRVAITTNIEPALVPDPTEQKQLIGQVTDVQHTAAAPSSVSIPMVPTSSLRTSATSWGACQGSC